jgi:hypothetical protein
VLADAVAAGRCAVAGVVYRLVEGDVTVVETVGEVAAPARSRDDVRHEH